MVPTAVRDAYTMRSAEYIDLLGNIEDAVEQDRQYVLAWARDIDGLILDVGCGPGQWTNYLCGNGIHAEGVDPVVDFVRHASQSYPGVSYRVGEAGSLEVPDASLGAILAWYSLIHTNPDGIDPLLREFARAIRPGGGLLIGFFEAPEFGPFDHAVATAYFWPVRLLCAHVEQAGFIVTDTQARSELGSRAHGAIIARLPL